MARVKGTANLAASLEVLAGAPLDARTKVPLKADLTASGTFPYPYEGMTVYVVEEKKSYTLIGADPTVSANWQEAGSGSGQTIQVDELPTASADELGKVYQYIGDTDTDYTHGFFYECVEGETAGTYEWTQTDTQPELEELSATDVQDIKDEFNPVNVPVISGAMNYSTEEQIVGKWIDGKPLYQKTIQIPVSAFISATPSSEGYCVPSVNHNISNIGVVVNLFGQAYGNVIRPLPFSYGANTPDFKFFASLGINATSIFIECGTEFRQSIITQNTYGAYVTIQYTKITD